MRPETVHEGQPLLATGELLENALAAMILIHGRGGFARQILALTSHFRVRNFAYLAPQAAGGTWYPQRFIVPRFRNQPYLDSALRVIDGLVDQITKAGISPAQIMFLGFSQGACLASEYVARHQQRFGGLVVFSGGLIGADEELVGYDSALAGTPVFLGCSDVDDHIPQDRVQDSANLFEAMGAKLRLEIYPGMGHTINSEEVEITNEMMGNLLG